MDKQYTPEIVTITTFKEDTLHMLEKKEIHVLMNGAIYEVKIKKFIEEKPNE